MAFLFIYLLFNQKHDGKQEKGQQKIVNLTQHAPFLNRLLV